MLVAPERSLGFAACCFDGSGGLDGCFTISPPNIAAMLLFRGFSVTIRQLVAVGRITTATAVPAFSSTNRLLHSYSSPHLLSLFTSSTLPEIGSGIFPSSFPHSQMMSLRWKTKVTRARAPDTPVKSKIKKYKIKGYSSYKRRFKSLNDGTIRRWKEGNAHNAHSKSKRQKRRLRKPALVSLAYAKVMKKLHFFG